MPWTEKKYSRINWRNRPSTATALGATNLNHMDIFLNDVDNALIEFESSKLNIATANSMIASLTIDTNSGVITAKELNGKTHTWDLNIEKIPVSFSLASNGILTMTTSDGTEFTANIADLIKEYVFDSSDTIAFTRSFTDDVYHVTAIIQAGSINADHLDPDYRADIINYTTTAQTAANDALEYSKDSKRWAVGDSEYPGSEVDNSKYYKEQAELARDAAEQARNEAQATTGIVIMAPGVLGVGMPDDVTIKADGSGRISAVTMKPGTLGVGMPDDVTIKVNEDGALTSDCFDEDGELEDED